MKTGVKKASYIDSNWNEVFPPEYGFEPLICEQGLIESQMSTSPTMHTLVHIKGRNLLLGDKQPFFRRTTKQTDSTGSLPVMGDLKKILDKGEYIPLKYAPVFESNFVQINSRGESIYLHNRPNYVTMGICASSRNLSLPNVMLLAHVTPSSSREDISTDQMCTRQSCSEDELVITRFLPLKFVDLSVHNARKRHFKLTLVNGRAYYLELCAPPQKLPQLFRQWVRLISVLKSKPKYSPVNALYKDLKTQEDNRAIRSKQAKGNIQVDPPTCEQTHQESMKLPITKKAPSKRVTISEIMIPSEGSQKSQSQASVSSYNYIKRSSGDLEKQSKYSKPSLMRTISSSKSRERRFFSNTEKKFQTAGILKNVS